VKEYVNNICNYFNNLKGYMEDYELLELIKLVNYNKNYEFENILISDNLTEDKIKQFNDYIIDDSDGLYEEIIKFLEEIKENN